MVISEEAIFHLLETYSYDRKDIGTSLKEEAMDAWKWIVKQSEKYSFQIKARKQGDYGIYSIQTSSKFVYHDNDLLYLHFPVTKDSMVKVSSTLTEFLFQRGTTFTIKLAQKIGCDNIVIGVHRKEDAKALVEFSHDFTEFQENVLLNNPFMAHENRVGVTRDFVGRSYTHQIASLLFQYNVELTQDILSGKEVERAYTFEHFVQYVMRECKNIQKKDITIRNLNYYVLVGMYSMDKECSFIDSLEYMPTITYHKEEKEKYSVHYENDNYSYSKLGEERITKQSHYLEWLELQTYQCMQRLYKELVGQEPLEDFSFEPEFCSFLSNTIDKIMSGNEKIYYPGYADTKISSLLPSLIAYYAKEAKLATLEEIKYIEQEAEKRLLVHSKSSVQCNFYQAGDKTLPSTITPICLPDCIVGIEYIIDDFCNIHILKDGKKAIYPSVFLEANKKLLCDSSEEETKKYRTYVGLQLQNFVNLPKQSIEKDGKIGTYISMDTFERDTANKTMS